jgi:CubicO group peptidase (beta-lactamase class C family)
VTDRGRGGRRRSGISAALLVAIGLSATAHAQSWPTSQPEDQGVDSQQLVAVFDAVRSKHLPIHSLLVIRNGVAVLDADFYPYSKNTPHDLASMTKSVIATLVGIAIDRGQIRLDQRVLEFFPGRTFANTDDRKRRLTVEHLLTMTSGICPNGARGEQQLEEQRRSGDWVRFVLNRPLVDEPGTRFAYCSEGSNLLSAILTRATGMTAEAYARKYLYPPLGISNVIWPKNPQGDSNGWGDTYMLPTDIAKIGYLFLKNGSWNGRQVLSNAFVTDATRRHVAVSATEGYGYKWWLASGPERFEARGRGGQRLIVIPSQQVVIVITGTTSFEPADIGGPLLGSIRSDAPLPRNPDAYDALMRKAAEARQAPAPQSVRPLPARAGRISGRTFTFADNPYGMKNVRLTFDRDGRSGAIRYSYVEPMNRHAGTSDSVFRLDGVYAMSNSSLIHRLPTGARGRWTSDDDFEVELNMAGFNHVFRFRFDFTEDRPAIRLVDDGMFDAVLPVIPDH